MSDNTQYPNLLGSDPPGFEFYGEARKPEHPDFLSHYDEGEECCDATTGEFWCTRTKGHPGRHAAHSSAYSEEASWDA